VGAGGGPKAPLASPRVCECVWVRERGRVGGDSAFVRYRVGVLSGWCAIGIGRDLLCVLSGRGLSGWCAIGNCVNFSCAIGLVRYRTVR